VQQSAFQLHEHDYTPATPSGATAAGDSGTVGAGAEALLLILRRRGLAMTDDQQRRIVTCTDLATVDHWLDRAFSVASVDELLT
jgi:hypothetical protein